MRRRSREESGQTIVEFAIICSVLMILTVGLVDAGRAFYQYNALSTAARYAARWGGVVGGTCSKPPTASNGDWCNQSSPATSNFWLIAGNKPLQSVGTSCPGSYQSNPSFSGYYTASTYKGTTTIVGAVAQRFDTDYNHKSKTVGDATPGFDLTQLKVCIQLPTITNGTTTWSTSAGDSVTVYLYYPFQPVSALFGRITLNLIASSQYEIE